jgi:RES domain-containing protein
VRVVYASTSLALAAVETFVNLELNLRPADLVSIGGEIPETVKVQQLDIHSLPRDWHRSRDESLRRFGDAWIRGGESAALLVPSAAIPGEWNVLLNPEHRDFPGIGFQAPVEFRFELRMFRE